MTLQSTALARLTIGLMQGIALYLLQRAFETKAWPATDGLIFAPLLVVAIFVPTIVVAGLGTMRPRARLSRPSFAQVWRYTISFVTQRAARPSSALPLRQFCGFAWPPAFSSLIL